jgi:hypothetical protein
LAAAIDRALIEGTSTAQRTIRARQRVESLFDVRGTVGQLLDVMRTAVSTPRSEASA